MNYTALQEYDDEETVQLCLTQREVAILKASLVPAYWSTRWDDLTISDDDLNEMVALIDAKLDIDCGFPMLAVTDIRQVGCILEMEIDEVWTPFADLSLCVTDTGTDLSVQIQLNINQAFTYINIYILNDQRSVNINAPLLIWDANDAGIPDPQRLTALCMAAQAYVGSYAAKKVQLLDAQFANAFFLISGLIELGGGIGVLAGFALFGALLEGVHNYADSRAALMDNIALELVACCMAEALQGETVDETEFALSLSSCGFAALTNEEIVREYVAASFSELESYLTFIDATGRAWVALTIGGIDDCLCDLTDQPVPVLVDPCAGGGPGGVDITHLGGIRWIMWTTERPAVPDTGAFFEAQDGLVFKVKNIVFSGINPVVSTSKNSDEVCILALQEMVDIFEAGWTWQAGRIDSITFDMYRL